MGRVPPTLASATLIERSAPFGLLVDALTAARSGRGRLVVVSGEAGAGKTSVVRAAATIAEPPAVWGFCEPFTTPRPAGPFRDIAERLWPPRVGGLDVGSLLPDRLLRWLSDGPSVLVIEDAHWIDSASADILRFLGRRIGALSAAVIVTTRDEGAGTGALWRALGDLGTTTVDRVEVPALSESVVRVMAGVTGAADLDVAEVMRATGGNAFLVTEMLATSAGLAGTLSSSVAARMARLPAAGREVVELASVIPGRSSAELFGASFRDVDDGVRHGLLRVDGDRVEFRHELVRRTVEESLPPGRRAALHASILRRLDALPGAEPSVVAHHARQAHDLARAFSAEREAAERAGRLGSHREAAAHARRAAEDATSVAPPRDRLLALIDLAEREWAIAQDVPAREAAESAVRLAAVVDDPALHGRALRALSRCTPAEADGLRWAREAVAVSEPLGASAARAAALANLAASLMLARHLGPAVSVGRQAIDIAEAVGDPPSRVTASNAVGSALLLRADLSGATLLRDGMHLAARHHLDAEVARCHTNLVSAAGEARLYPLSEAAHTEALRYFLARDLDGMAGYTRAWHARCLFERGRWTEALDEVEEVMADPGRVTGIAGQAANIVLARIRTRQGRAGVEGPLSAAQAFAEASGSLQRLAPVVAARAEYCWTTGRPLPVDALRAVDELAAGRDSPWASGEVGFWLWRAGESDRRSTAASTPFDRWIDGDVEGAAQAWVDLGCPYEAADAWTDSTDPELVRRALQIFTGLGAAPARARAAQRLRELGQRSVPRGPRPQTMTDPDGLTGRQRETASLLRAGLTDAEIAARLHLSVRTVGHHVSAVLRKTGARSRRDLRDPG
jgi:DNA-binding CsgD family transcriptional regulator